MLEDLKERVLRQNLALVKHGLVILTWGNVSAIDRKSGYVVIKPSGVSYDKMTVEDMVVVDLDGKTVEGKYRPSSDTPTHLELYKAFADIGGVVHTHSVNATAFAQAGKSIVPLGTTHADAFYGNVPVTRQLTEEEINSDYERNTGKVIIETFSDKDYAAIPAVLIHSHGVFTWGATPEKAVENSVIVESVAEMALKTIHLDGNLKTISQCLLDKHYNRKHGKNAYYGQMKN